MTDSNATYATSIFCRIPDRAGEKITFTNASGFFISGNQEIYPKTQYILTLDNSGEGTQILPCPDNTGDSAINWRINLPSKESGTYAIGYDVATQQLATILAAQSTTADPDVILALLANVPTADEAAWLAAAADRVADGDDIAERDTDGTPGNLTVLDADRNAVDAGYGASAFDAAGSAAAAQAAAIAQATSGLVPLPLEQVVVFDRGADPTPVSVLSDGTLVGAITNSFYFSTDAAVTWSLVGTFPANPVYLINLSDGEIILSVGVSLYRSTGWATNPATATYTKVLDSSGANASFLPRTMDAYQQYVLVAEYGDKAEPVATRAKKYWLSSDYGATFTEIFNLFDEYGDVAVHPHGVAIDQWGSRIYITHGDAGFRGIRYRALSGGAWTLVSDLYQPTTATATANGIFFGTDNPPNGILLLRRGSTTIETAYLINDRSAALTHVAENVWKAPDGTYYISWISALAGETAIILATRDGLYFSEVWRDTITHDPQEGVNFVCETDGEIIATLNDSRAGNSTLRTQAAVVGSRVPVDDAGRVMGGVATILENSTAVGRGTASGQREVSVGALAATSNNDSVAVGYQATASGNGATAVGYQAQATGTSAVGIGGGVIASSSRSVAVGPSATAAGIQGVSIGYQAAGASAGDTAIGDRANASGVSVAIGRESDATTLWATAVGYQAQALRSKGTAIGRNAQAITADSTTAIGESSTASHTNSVALGANTSTQATNQVAVGARDIEIQAAASGIILRDTNGVRYRITVSTSGTLVVTAL